jgi:hypothetical protein
MFGEIQFELSGIHTILLFLIVGGAIAILFFEIKKLKILVDSIIKEKGNNPINLTNLTSETSVPRNKVNNTIPSDISNINVQSELTKNAPINAPINAPVNDPINDRVSGPISSKNIQEKEKPVKDFPSTNPSNNEIEDISKLMEDSDDESIKEMPIQLPGEIILDKDSKTDSDDSDDSDDIDDIDDSDDSDDIDDIDKLIGNDDISLENKEEINYSQLTVNELKSILSQKNLPLSGNKTKLIERIKSNM